MKNRIVCILLAALAFSGGLWAQDSGQNFFKSIGLVYTISLGKTGDNADKSINQSMGLTANFFIFSGSDEKLGYYLSPGIDLRMKQDAKDLQRMDIYLGAAFGPAFRIHDSSEVDILSGIGPDISCTVRLGDSENGRFGSTKVFLGLGLGGSIEARLKLYNTIALTGGMLMKYNFAPYSEDNAFIAGPYVGIGF